MKWFDIDISPSRMQRGSYFSHGVWFIFVKRKMTNVTTMFNSFSIKLMDDRPCSQLQISSFYDMILPVISTHLVTDHSWTSSGIILYRLSQLETVFWCSCVSHWLSPYREQFPAIQHIFHFCIMLIKDTLCHCEDELQSVLVSSFSGHIPNSLLSCHVK